MKKVLIIPALLLLTACSSSAGPATDYHSYLRKKKIPEVTLESIPHCHGYGCRLKGYTSLTKAEWKQIGKYFKTKRTAEQERAAIAKAIGQFERTMGKKFGTDQDIAGTYVQLGDEQQDCVDESVNTTIYLDLLNQKKLLKHHDVSGIGTRIPVVGGGGGFHQTAVIVDRVTGTRYAVDSWFHDGGHDAEVVLLSDWLYGWHPKNE
jgi:hypothetical protein